MPWHILPPAVLFSVLLIPISCTDVPAPRSTLEPNASRTAQATPTSTRPIVRATVTPTPPSPSHPAGTRTGIPIVDAVLDATESGDTSAIAALISYTYLTCGGSGIGSFACPNGLPEGSLVEAFVTGSCHGAAVAGGTDDMASAITRMVESLKTLDRNVYAVFRTLSPNGGLRYVIVDVRGSRLEIDENGVVGSFAGCGAKNGEQLLKNFAASQIDFVLPPAR